MFWDVKGGKEGFCKSISSQRKTRESMEETKVLNASFALVFIGKISLLEFQALETSGKFWSSEDLTPVENQLKEHLNKFALRKWCDLPECTCEC